jgi:SNF2 family DNA or RNA helicase
MLMMRFAADDPNLIVDSAKLFAKNMDPKGNSPVGSQLAHAIMLSGALGHVPAVSTKRQLFMEMLTQVFDEDERNKVVAFSTFKAMGRRVRDDTAGMTKSVEFTGDMNAWAKSQSMATFKDDPECRLFMSSDAGGYGVDLPEANYLYSIDLPWSTGAFEQREARIIRISSEWEHVSLTTLQAAGTIDEWMFEKIGVKHGVSAAFIDGHFDSQGAFTPKLSSLTAFLAEHR